MNSKVKEYINKASISEFISIDNKFRNTMNLDELNISDKGRVSNPIFKAYGYPSKIYYPNIQKYINAYTEEGAVVLDSFCGSGTTGIAALLENRKAILVDSSPQAINITLNTLDYVDIEKIKYTYEVMKKDLDDLIKDLYKVINDDGTIGYIETIITSNVYRCKECNSEIVLYGSATGKRSEYKCKECGNVINISKQEIKDTIIERRRPIEVNLRNLSSGKRENRKITEKDIILWDEKYKEYNDKYGDLWSPDTKIVYNRCYPRVGGWPGFPIDASVSDLFPEKNLLALKIIYNYINTNIKDEKINRFFNFVFTEILFRSSKRLFVTSGIKNVYHVPPLGKEQNVMNVFERKMKTILKAKEFIQEQIQEEVIENNIKVIKGNSKKLDIPNNSIDYAFIDPPYGGIVPYAELNLFYSAWLKEEEDLENEVIIPMDYDKKPEYVAKWGEDIERAFREVYRVLKPGAYFTIVFQSKFKGIWDELRDLMINRIGFEFINIVSNERSNTFHTNHINDTNPQSGYITYKKPLYNPSDENIELWSNNMSELTKEIELTNRHIQCLEALTVIGEATAREVAQYMFDKGYTKVMERNMAHPRLNELQQAGYIEIVGKRLDEITNRQVSIYSKVK